MCELKKSLIEIFKTSVDDNTLTAFIFNKDNAKLGDGLVNLIYSLAKTVVSGNPTGVKVSDSILSEAYKRSLWKESNQLTITGNKGRVADAIEALILYFWVFENLSLIDLVTPIKEHLKPKNLHHPREEHNSAVLSFQNLLNSLFVVYNDTKMKSKQAKNKNNINLKRNALM
ncbi:MAG: ribonuclease III family protein [Candidatus Hodarchaeota archaeon]